MTALDEYLIAHCESPSRFARRIGRSPSTLLRALKGERDPSMQLARDVEHGTEGAVSASEFLAICLAAGQPRLAAA